MAVVKNPPGNAGATGDADSIPGLGRSPRVRNSNPLHYSCQNNPMYRGAWWATVHGDHKKLDTNEQLSTHSFSFIKVSVSSFAHFNLFLNFCY